MVTPTCSTGNVIQKKGNAGVVMKTTLRRTWSGEVSYLYLAFAQGYLRTHITILRMLEDNHPDDQLIARHDATKPPTPASGVNKAQTQQADDVSDTHLAGYSVAIGNEAPSSPTPSQSCEGQEEGDSDTDDSNDTTYRYSEFEPSLSDSEQEDADDRIYRCHGFGPSPPDSEGKMLTMTMALNTHLVIPTTSIQKTTQSLSRAILANVPVRSMKRTPNVKKTLRLPRGTNWPVRHQQTRST